MGDPKNIIERLCEEPFGDSESFDPSLCLAPHNMDKARLLRPLAPKTQEHPASELSDTPSSSSTRVGTLPDPRHSPSNPPSPGPSLTNTKNFWQLIWV